MSEVKVDKISPRSGTDVTLGDSSDTFTLPSGSAITVASGGDINVASGGEIDIASGATLDVNGTIDLTGATKTGFPAGGNTDCSVWRLTSTFADSATPIASNISEVDNYGYARLGTVFAAPSSGIFTFPSTGYWFVVFNAVYDKVRDTDTVVTKVMGTTDDGSYNPIGAAYAGTDREGFSSCVCSALFDCVATATHKVRFDIVQSYSTNTIVGDANVNYTYMTFLRLADT